MSTLDLATSNAIGSSGTLLSRTCVALLAFLIAGIMIAAAANAQPSDTVRVSYTVTSQWESGFTAELTVANDANRAIADWRLAFRFAPQITSIWNARVVSRSDGEYVIGPVEASWEDGELASGEAVKIGFVATGAAATGPADVYLNGAAVRLNASSPAPPPQRPTILSAPAWPQRVFAPYVDATAWPQLDLATVARALEVRHFRFGFVVAKSATEAEPSWGGSRSATSTYRLAEVNALRALGGDVAIAFGGATGIELASAAKSAGRLASMYKAVVDAYGARVLDFDIEGRALVDRASIARRAEALSILQAGMKKESRPLEVWFTLPVMPSGLTPEGVHLIRATLQRGVDIRGINIMAMNYGAAAAPKPTNRMGALAIAAAHGVHAQLIALYAGIGAPKQAGEVWQMIGITPMIGRNDVLTESFQQADAEELVLFARQHRVGLLSFWSLNRDQSCESPRDTVSPACSGISQRDYEFTRLFGEPKLQTRDD